MITVTNTKEIAALVVFVEQERRGREMTMSKFTFDDYWCALDGAGPKLKEIILERASHDANIEFPELKRLADRAYPEGC